MYADLIFGNTASLKAAQCGHVIEAYSVIVTEASAGASDTSGSRTRFGRIGGALRHRVGDQQQRRKPGESGKSGQRQGGGEGAARDHRGFAPGLARSRP